MSEAEGERGRRVMLKRFKKSMEHSGNSSEVQGAHGNSRVQEFIVHSLRCSFLHKTNPLQFDAIHKMLYSHIPPSIAEADHGHLRTRSVPSSVSDQTID